jgi:hypothetical protein
MRLIAARLGDICRLAIGEIDRLWLGERRLGGGLENVVTGLPGEAKLAVPDRRDGQQRRPDHPLSPRNDRAIGREVAVIPSNSSFSISCSILKLNCSTGTSPSHINSPTIVNGSGSLPSGMSSGLPRSNSSFCLTPTTLTSYAATPASVGMLPSCVKLPSSSSSAASPASAGSSMIRIFFMVNLALPRIPNGPNL